MLIRVRSAWQLGLIAVLCVVAVVGVVAQDRKEVDAESYDVYSAVLTRHYKSWFMQKEPVLIIAHTVLEPQGHTGSAQCRGQEGQDADDQELLDKLVAEKLEFRIEGKLRLPGPYKMLKGKAGIRENQEPGVVFLSAVEFSTDRSKAMVLVGHNCGGLCGDGIVRTLVKRGDGWHLANNQLNCGWIK